MTDDLRIAEPSGDEILRAHLASALRLAVMLVGDRSVAEDIAAESVARLLAAGRRVQIDNANAYLRRIVVNQVIGRRRRRAPERRFAHRLAAVPDDARDDERVVGRATLADALDRLASRQRAVLVLRYYEDLSEAEVAALLRIPLGTVKSTASRALDELRRVLGEDGDGG